MDYPNLQKKILKAEYLPEIHVFSLKTKSSVKIYFRSAHISKLRAIWRFLFTKHHFKDEILLRYRRVESFWKTSTLAKIVETGTKMHLSFVEPTQRQIHKAQKAQRSMLLKSSSLPFRSLEAKDFSNQNVDKEIDFRRINILFVKKFVFQASTPQFFQVTPTAIHLLGVFQKKNRNKINLLRWTFFHFFQDFVLPDFLLYKRYCFHSVIESLWLLEILSHITLNTEGKQNLAIEITDPKRHLKPWSEIRLTLLETLYHLSIKVGSTSRLETSTSHSLSLGKSICQSCLSRFRHFTTQYLKDSLKKQRKNGQFIIHTVSWTKQWYVKCNLSGQLMFLCQTNILKY